MLTPLDFSAGAPAAVLALSSAASQLQLARENLIIAAARTQGAAMRADWRSPTAARFHERVRELSGRLRAAEVRSDELTDAALRARARVAVAAGGAL
jgi:hypothetical protein